MVVAEEDEGVEDKGWAEIPVNGTLT
jgi:hypothetical protein